MILGGSLGTFLVLVYGLFVHCVRFVAESGNVKDRLDSLHGTGGS